MMSPQVPSDRDGERGEQRDRCEQAGLGVEMKEWSAVVGLAQEGHEGIL